MYAQQGYPPMGGDYSRHPGAPGKRMTPDGAGRPTDMGGQAMGAQERDDHGNKRSRLVWTAQLHERFADAINQLGLKNAVPKTIMQVRSSLGSPYS